MSRSFGRSLVMASTARSSSRINLFESRPDSRIDASSGNAEDAFGPSQAKIISSSLTELGPVGLVEYSPYVSKDRGFIASIRERTQNEWDESRVWLRVTYQSVGPRFQQE